MLGGRYLPTVHCGEWANSHLYAAKTEWEGSKARFGDDKMAARWGQNARVWRFPGRQVQTWGLVMRKGPRQNDRRRLK